jgi:hypothetical protein
MGRATKSSGFRRSAAPKCTCSVDAGALEEPSDMEYEWRRRCFEVGAEYLPPGKTEIACASRDPKRARSMASGRYKAMKARIAAAVVRKAKKAGAEQRAVEERRTADERDAAMKLKRAAERAAAEEASIRRATVRPRASNKQ